MHIVSIFFFLSIFQLRFIQIDPLPIDSDDDIRKIADAYLLPKNDLDLASSSGRSGRVNHLIYASFKKSSFQDAKVYCQMIMHDNFQIYNILFCASCQYALIMVCQIIVRERILNETKQDM